MLNKETDEMTHKLVHESKNYNFKVFMVLIGEFPVALVKVSSFNNDIYNLHPLDDSFTVLKEVVDYCNTTKWSEE